MTWNGEPGPHRGSSSSVTPLLEHTHPCHQDRCPRMHSPPLVLAAAVTDALCHVDNCITSPCRLPQMQGSDVNGMGRGRGGGSPACSLQWATPPAFPGPRPQAIPSSHLPVMQPILPSLAQDSQAFNEPPVGLMNGQMHECGGWDTGAVSQPTQHRSRRGRPEGGLQHSDLGSTLSLLPKPSVL